MSEKIVSYFFKRSLTCLLRSVVMNAKILMSLYVDFDIFTGSIMSRSSLLNNRYRQLCWRLLSVLCYLAWWSVVYRYHVQVCLGLLCFMEFRKHIFIEHFLLTPDTNYITSIRNPLTTLNGPCHSMANLLALFSNNNKTSSSEWRTMLLVWTFLYCLIILSFLWWFNC